MTDTRIAVKRYLDLGLRPIPVWPPSAGCRCERPHPTNPEQCHGKVPRARDWADRLAPYAQADFAPDDNVALAMGRQPDGRWLVGIDYDGTPTVPWGELPPTLTTTSGRGKHYIYQAPSGAPLGNWIDVLGARDKTMGYRPGHAGAVDLRYARGAVVAAPSLHRSGVRYTSNGAPIAPLPDRVALAVYSERRKRGLPVLAQWRREGKRA